MLSNALALAGLSVLAVSAVAITASGAQIQSAIPDDIRQGILSWAQGDEGDQTLVENVQIIIEDELVDIPAVERLEMHNRNLRIVLTEYDRIVWELLNKDANELTISVHNNKATYGPGDSIIIFGFVSRIVDGHAVGIVISDSTGRTLAIAEIPPNADGSYAFLASDPVFRELGKYYVNVYYGGSAYSNTSYVYNPGG